MVLELLRANPLLVLFGVMALGYLLGSVRIGGFSLGVAAVLFAGLGVGAIDAGLKLPEFVQSFGLALFAYTVGLSSGPGFVRALRRRGVRDAAMALGAVAAGAALIAAIAAVLGLPATRAVGAFAGALTNTPALAAALERLQASVPPELRERLLAEPVVAYSVTYPLGVMVPLVALTLARRLWPAAQGTQAPELSSLVNRTLRLTQPSVAGKTARQVLDELKLPVLFGRLRRGQRVSLVLDDTPFELHDVLSLVGDEASVAQAAHALGALVDEHLELDRRVLDFRRIFVSNPEVVGRRLSELRLPQRFDARLTRLRRGDVEFLPSADTVLELGDRVRVVAPRQQLAPLTTFFGDSYKALSELDVLTFSVGLALGLLLGVAPLPLPTGGTFRLGSAGGPLLVGLLLGALERTGPVVWQPPYSVGLTLRQLGVVLFLAGVGTRSGPAFAATIGGDGVLELVLGGALVSACVSALVLLAGRRSGLSLPLTSGLLAGVTTQPAVLAAAVESSSSDEPNVGYATVYPVAMIAKILLAQVLVAWLRSGLPAARVPPRPALVGAGRPVARPLLARGACRSLFLRERPDAACAAGALTSQPLSALRRHPHPPRPLSSFVAAGEPEGESLGVFALLLSRCHEAGEGAGG